jgi:hypothetical protein
MSVVSFYQCKQGKEMRSHSLWFKQKSAIAPSTNANKAKKCDRVSQFGFTFQSHFSDWAKIANLWLLPDRQQRARPVRAVEQMAAHHGQ